MSGPIDRVIEPAPILRLTVAMWLGLAAAAFGLTWILLGFAGPLGATLTIALLFCGTCGAWMAFGGGSADRESAWLLMLGWGVSVQIAAPLIIGLQSTTMSQWIRTNAGMSVVLPSLITSGVLAYATRSWAGAAGPAAGATLLLLLGALGPRALEWAVPVWLSGVSAGMAVWACRVRMHHDSVVSGRVCGHCGYDLAGLTEPMCPECGQPPRTLPKSFPR